MTVCLYYSIYMASKKTSKIHPAKHIYKKSNKKKFEIETIYNSKIIVPVLCGLLIIAAFFIGVTVTKLQLIQKSNSTVPTASSQPTIINKPLHVAASIGINPSQFKQCLESNKFTQAVANDLQLGQKAGVSGTPSIFVNNNLIIGAQPYSAFQTAINQELANPNSPLPSTTPTAVNIDTSSFPVLGNANAPVTIVEFGDFQCPYCDLWYKQTLPQIISNYINTGKAKMIFQNYAILGPDSTTAAKASYCANQQGQFWKYYNFMYEHQGQEDSGWANEQNLL